MRSLRTRYETKIPKKNKYNAKKAEANGIVFDSILEKDYFLHLCHLEKYGHIKLLETQVKCYLTKAKILMKPDFKIFNNKTGKVEFHETKGHETTTYRIKRRLWKHYGEGKLVIIKRKGNKFFVSEEVINEN